MMRVDRLYLGDEASPNFCGRSVDLPKQGCFRLLKSLRSATSSPCAFGSELSKRSETIELSVLCCAAWSVCSCCAIVCVKAFKGLPLDRHYPYKSWCFAPWDDIVWWVMLLYLPYILRCAKPTFGDY